MFSPLRYLTLDVSLDDVRRKPCSERTEQKQEDERADLTLGVEVLTDVLAEGVALSLVEYRPELEREEHHEREGVTDAKDHVGWTGFEPATSRNATSGRSDHVSTLPLRVSSHPSRTHLSATHHRFYRGCLLAVRFASGCALQCWLRVFGSRLSAPGGFEPPRPPLLWGALP